MNAHEVLRTYYTLANAGEWDRWCDLFTADTVMDEQLAGHIEGRETLRSMMQGFPDMYSAFENKPLHFVVAGDGAQAAVVSRITARTAKGDLIEADVMNYFRIERGLIAYMSNFHDTKPFAPLTQG